MLLLEPDPELDDELEEELPLELDDPLEPEPKACAVSVTARVKTTDSAAVARPMVKPCFNRDIKRTPSVMIAYRSRRIAVGKYSNPVARVAGLGEPGMISRILDMLHPSAVVPQNGQQAGPYAGTKNQR